MSTFPFLNNVAAWFDLSTIIAPVAANVPTAGLYSSALTVSGPLPPTMSPIPLPKRVAVWSSWRAPPRWAALDSRKRLVFTSTTSQYPESGPGHEGQNQPGDDATMRHGQPIAGYRPHEY